MDECTGLIKQMKMIGIYLDKLYSLLLLTTILFACNQNTAQNGTFDVIIDTDLGGDPDDIQSLYRAVHYSDIIKIKGIIATPNSDIDHHPWDTIEHTGLIENWIKRIDVEHIRKNGYSQLMQEKDLLSIIKSGAKKPKGPSDNNSTEGSEWIIKTARDYTKDNPLWILVWGSLTTTAQALYDAPDIADKIRIYYISSSNTLHDPISRDYVYNFMEKKYPELWWIENGILPRGKHETFRGVYQSGIQDGEWSYTKFTDINIRNHGSNHDGLFQEKCGDVFPVANYPKNSLKEGDSPSLLYLISPVIGGTGNVDDPTQESWGGQFRHFEKSTYPNYYIDLDKSPSDCQMTIGKWRYSVMNDWKQRWDRYDKK
ncbi:nucleoside hydrolase-like domain-containing protein [Arenibacter sp. M-2]|uniref:nucleoside hydrolase-like domain-containing protein n=1 Tax=Arenibacter sp. M-2 TaxID=3053612 RepID=UPI0025708EBC|nr:nucleoside hydrolase-like domain-containing protein [Arenibacter sp. M-2]